MQKEPILPKTFYVPLSYISFALAIRSDVYALQPRPPEHPKIHRENKTSSGLAVPTLSASSSVGDDDECDIKACYKGDYSVHYFFSLSLFISFFRYSISFVSLLCVLLIANVMQPPVMMMMSAVNPNKYTATIVTIVPATKPMILRGTFRAFSSIMDLFSCMLSFLV